MTQNAIGMGQQVHRHRGLLPTTAPVQAFIGIFPPATDMGPLPSIPPRPLSLGLQVDLGIFVSGKRLILEKSQEIQLGNMLFGKSRGAFA